ncbi:MAG TPA: tannase/feruloyl esterase family alpha/beta hydrolase [Vicinamibacterales bacterium]|nr:tannase/feruloyl esterase family alpha/beta hydrolase [Vicinamibacterales bacterium]
MRHSIWQDAAVALAIAATVALAGPQAQSQDATKLATECASLKDLAIPASAIGLPTSGGVIQTAVMVAANEPRNANGNFCKVTGILKPKNPSSPNLEFEVNLPASWNGRALQMGGGGYDGSLVTGLTGFTLQTPNTDTPLRQGYVTLGSDGGHKGGPGFDGSFGLDDEALLNYGKQSVKKAHDAAMVVIKKAYGRTPQRFYFIGGSQGGHEALDAAARYPEDYDGVVAHYPAYNVTMLHLGSWNVGKALYDDGGTGWMDAKHTKLITDAVMAACDTLDGAKDGIISNVAGCDSTFDVKKLRCATGSAGDNCLSDAQLKAVARITSDYKPGFKVAGMDTFPKWALLEGAQFQGASNFGSVQQPSNPLSGKEPLLYSAGDATIKFIITRDPKFDTLHFDPKQYRARIATVASIMDVTDQSLDKFRAKGGKIIMTHGTADDFITPHNSIAYYKRQVAQFGQQRLDSFMRFYVIPGLGHGFGAPFTARFDSLSALQRWVEQGKAPAGLVTTDATPNANRTRPLCEYPKWPKFTGTPGTENSAASFTCTDN